MHGVHLALTTDWLVTFGGAERVLAEMHRLWPDAPIFTTLYNEQRMTSKQMNESTIITSHLQRWYRLLGSHRLLLPWMPQAVETWDLRSYDVVVSSSHAVAKGCLPSSNAKHICYCHTPMRYAWEMEEQYLDDYHLLGPVRSFVQWQLKRLRRWDLTSAKRVDLFIANSRTTQERIQRIYERESIILHPPVDDRFFRTDIRRQTSDVRGNSSLGSKVSHLPPHFLAVGRLVPYKRFDLLIDVANTLKLSLCIAGEGPDLSRLQRLAGPTVTFLGHVPEGELPSVYAQARALLFPTYEDAGIVPLEAQACGTPVIALGKGGALDTVCGAGVSPAQSPTGVFFREQTASSLIDALKRFEEVHCDAAIIREHARKFSSSCFRERLREIVEKGASL